MYSILLIVTLAVAPEEKVELQDLGITLPATIAGIKYTRRSDFKEASAGYSVSYGNEACKLTLYVYDGGQKDIPTGKTGKMIEDQLKDMGSELARFENQGVLKNVKQLDTDPPFPKTVLEKFAASSFTFDIDSGGCKSYALLTGYKGRYFKIRATQYVVDGKTNDKELHKFLEDIAGRLNPPAK
jgi:hypothetical protein